MRRFAPLLVIAPLLLLAPREQAAVAHAIARPGDVSVLTYNVHGLPWPIVEDRGDQLTMIGERLAQLRAQGREPRIVALQEAFTGTAKRIGEIGGYQYQAAGPGEGESDPAPVTPADRWLETGARWLKGEDLGKWESSGLRVFSDYPIVAVQRFSYGDVDCAGFDCLANKGVLLTTIAVPGHGLVQVATTHLNSRHASGVPDARSVAAYRRQVAMLDGFIHSRADPRLPLIVTGDFNVGDAPGRRPALLRRAATWGADPEEALRSCAGKGRTDHPRDAAEIIRRARDWQFVYAGAGARLTPAFAQIPFGRGRDGRMLSDHIGFAIRYDWAV